MTLRLDPAIPLVWRDPHTLQFGVDPVVTVLDVPTPALERLVSALVVGVPEQGFRMLADAERIGAARGDRLLAQLAPCLLPEPVAAPGRRAIVLGAGPLARGIARLLEELGLRTSDPGDAALAVLVSDRVVLPPDHRGWLQRDIPHLPLVADDSSVTLGPLVVPGRSACLHCAALHRRDDDPAWPAIAAQLARHPAPAGHPVRTASAIAHAARLITAALAGTAEAGREVRLTGDGERLSERTVAPHPECRCAAPPENDWAPAGESASPPAASAARASAGRA